MLNLLRKHHEGDDIKYHLLSFYTKNKMYDKERDYRRYENADIVFE